MEFIIKVFVHTMVLRFKLIGSGNDRIKYFPLFSVCLSTRRLCTFRTRLCKVYYRFNSSCTCTTKYFNIKEMGPKQDVTGCSQGYRMIVNIQSISLITFHIFIKNF